MAKEMRLGHVIDTGTYWLVIARAFQCSEAGVQINRTGDGNMDARECREMASALLRMADACDRINHQRAVAT